MLVCRQLELAFGIISYDVTDEKRQSRSEIYTGLDVYKTDHFRWTIYLIDKMFIPIGLVQNY